MGNEQKATVGRPRVGPTFSFKAPRSLIEAVDRAASAENKTRSDLLRELMETYLKTKATDTQN